VTARARRELRGSQCFLGVDLKGKNIFDSSTEFSMLHYIPLSLIHDKSTFANVNNLRNHCLKFSCVPHHIVRKTDLQATNVV